MDRFIKLEYDNFIKITDETTNLSAEEGLS